MNYQIQLINENKEILAYYIPQKYLEENRNKPYCFFVAIAPEAFKSNNISENNTIENNGKTIAGLIYYTQSTLQDSSIELSYIYVKEEYRNKGVASELISSTIELLKKNGYKSVAVSMLPDSNVELISLLNTFNFSKESSVLTYAYSMLVLTNKLFKPDIISKLDAYTDNVKRINEIDGLSLDLFLKEIKATGRRFDPYGADPFYTLYYQEKGSIIAYASMRYISQKILELNDFLSLNIKQNQIIEPSFFATILDHYLDDLDEDASIYFSLDNTHFLQTLRDLVGEPAIILTLSSYQKTLL